MTNTTREQYLQNIDVLKNAAELYYEGVEESPLLDDEYDELVEAVAAAGEAHNWVEHVQFTENVAAGVIRGSETGVVRENLMLSLRKVITGEQVDSFLANIPKGAKLCFEPKLDGFALSAHYAGGKLVSLTVRGDGETGDDITANVLANANIANLPTTVNTLDEFEVRGEVYITTSDFEKANEARVEKGKAPYTLERSAAAGVVRSSTPVKHVPLTYAIYDVFAENQDDSYSKNIAWAESLGFMPASRTYAPSKEGMTALEIVEEFGQQRPTMEEPTDGLVIKLDSMSQRVELGNGSRHPYWAVAFKYPTPVRRTVFREMIRTIGRTGAVTYVARFDPIELEGSTVSRATANNASFINALDLHYGDTILVRKAKQIIPQIRGVIAAERPADAEKYTAPTTCPVCEQEMDQSSLIWRCLDSNCSTLENIIYAVSKDHLDVEGLSRGRVTLMFEQGLISDIPSLYSLTVDQISEVGTGRIGTKSGEEIVIGETVAATIFDGLQAAKKQPLHRILSAVGVRHLGRTVSREFARNYKTLDRILSLTVEEVADYELRGKKFGTPNAERLVNDLQARAKTFKALKQLGFVALNEAAEEANADEPIAAGGKLDGKKVLVSGSVPGYTRTTVQEAIEAAGGTNASSVSSTLSFLVADPASGSSKVVKAKKLGITIISPEDFVGML